MLLRPIPIAITSTQSVAAILARLREHAHEWRESKVSPTARAAGILGWRLKQRGDRVVLRVPFTYGSAFVPHFAGRVCVRETGAEIVGTIRMSWFPRFVMLLWLAAFVMAPFVALLLPKDTSDVGIVARVVMFVFLAPLCLGFIYLGLGMVQHGTDGPAGAIYEVLLDAATPRDAARDTPLRARDV